MTAKPELLRLDQEVRDAWSEYLGAVKDKEGESYTELEAWAWARLLQVLRTVRRRRKRLAV